MYHTLILKKDLKAGTPDQINLSEIKYNIKIESIYANDKMGETSTFLTGTNEKELYFVALFFNKNYFHKVSLIKSSIIDPKLPLRVYGNFRTEEIAYSNIQFPTYEKKEVNIKLYDQGMKIFLNDQKILSYESTSREKWRLSSNNFFGIGIRGAHAWIDDVNLVGKNNIADKEDSILFEDKFNNVKIMRLTFKKIK
jgi:hypothetical protein